MRVRAAVLGFVAVGVLFAMPRVGVAGAEESTQTTTEKIEEADISIAYPSAWHVTTSEAAKDDAGPVTTQFAVEGSDGSMMVSTTALKGRQKDDRSAKAFKEMTDDLRAHQDKDFKFLYGARQKLGNAVAWRSDLGIHPNTAGAFRQSDTNIGLTNDSGERVIVIVTVYTPLDDQGRAFTDRILASVRRL
jgi:hypothetical protein